MREDKEWNDIAGLNRLILKASWWMVLVIILLSVTGILITYQFNGKGLIQMAVSYVILPTIYTVVILTLTQVLYSMFRHWGDYILLIGVFAILHVYILNFPFAQGIHYLLIISVLISALYFQKEKVYFTGILSLISIFSLYFFYEPFADEIARRDIYAFIGIFIGFVFISVGIIYRGHYLLKHLEESIRNQEELMVRNIMMDKASKMDGLTDLYNHKTFHEYLDRLIEQSDKSQLSFQLAIIDIDNFKKVNDQFGHWVGDIVLARVGEQLKLNVTPDDFVSRYGGEEFAVILTEKGKKDSFQLVDEIRANISEMVHPEMDNKPVTVSVGMCSYEAGLDKENFFKAADDSLYQAKRNGKNQTVMARI
ncbi:GGDEF domain-containing protein [Mesobacillus jeotgali]|uniref:GGDEF domain-containing protein n=1 Tax=Mesobacillus jeotgali TaxID=129985 RepID=UPI0009A5C2F1|nr:GGDEF domain-containing protein [Mesobacillus jeotgali]